MHTYDHVIQVICLVYCWLQLFLHWCRNPGGIATGGGLALPEPLHDEDTRSWFKRFEVCLAVNGWDATKQLLRLPTLLRGHAWAIFDSLGDSDTDIYDHF